MTHLFFQPSFPINFLKDVVIPETNANLDSTRSQHLTMSEFLSSWGAYFSWLGWIVMIGGLYFPLIHSKVPLFL